MFRRGNSLHWDSLFVCVNTRMNTICVSVSVAVWSGGPFVQQSCPLSWYHCTRVMTETVSVTRLRNLSITCVYLKLCPYPQSKISLFSLCGLIFLKLQMCNCAVIVTITVVPAQGVEVNQEKNSKSSYSWHFSLLKTDLHIKSIIKIVN